MPILALIKLTAMDLVRRRIFVLLALFAFTMVLLSFFLRDLTIGQWTRLITDVGLGATDLALTLLAIFVGASLIAGDLDIPSSPSRCPAPASFMADFWACSPSSQPW